MPETPESIAKFLVALAADLRDGKPIESVLEELDDTIDDWRKEFDFD